MVLSRAAPRTFVFASRASVACDGRADHEGSEERDAVLAIPPQKLPSGGICYHAARVRPCSGPDAVTARSLPARLGMCVMASTAPPTYGELLRRLRVQAGLTQEELAARAGLSPRAISDLERGISQTPRRDTAELLADALSLAPDARAHLELAIRRGRTPAPTRQATPSPAQPLPLPPTLLIGREHEEAAISHQLLLEDVRLLTLTGPAGIGKTRLALQVAAGVQREVRDGATLVTLAAIRDPRLVLTAIAEALGIREAGNQPVRETVIAFLRDKELLLVLDNCEQVLSMAPDLAELLAACSGLKVLATSRAALRIRGEFEFAVPALELPRAGGTDTPDQLSQYAAVALFLQRVRDSAPTFQLTPAQAPAVAAICLRLEGLPLAIELAAARIKLLPPQALLARLEPRLTLLTGGARDLPERQQTMRAAISWSYDLLNEPTQALFRRLAVFVGGWTLEAAASVCDASETSESDLLEGLAALTENNLARQGEFQGEPRFSMLELIREFGLERLEASAEAEAVQQRYVEYYLRLAEQGEVGLKGPEQPVWLERLANEQANIRATLQWARKHDGVELGLRLAGALWLFWYTRGYLSGGRGWLEELLALDAGGERHAAPAVRAKALYSIGVLATEQGDYARAEELASESLTIFEELGDLRGQAAALNIRGSIAKYQGDYARAVILYEACLVLRRELGDPVGTAVALNNLGTIAGEQCQHDRAIELYTESLALKRTLGDARGIANTLLNLGDVARNQGRFEQARLLTTESHALFAGMNDQRGTALALNNLGEVARDSGKHDDALIATNESLKLFREMANTWGIALALNNLGDLAYDSGELEQAAALYRESLELYRAEQNMLGIVESLEGLGSVRLAQGSPAPAAHLYAKASALRYERATPLPLVDRTSFDIGLAGVRAAMDEVAFSAAWALGQAMTLEDAITRFDLP